MKKIGMAFVGSGFLSEKFAICYRKHPAVELVSVCSRTEENAKNFASKYGLKAWYTDYEEMFKRNDVDAVNVCTPNYLHAAMTVSAAEHGKHVLCTKPLAISMQQADEMVQACRKAGVNFMYGENWLYTPAAERLYGIIEEGGLGKIYAMEAREQHSGSHSLYATKKKYAGGGVLIHMAVHPIGLIMYMMKQSVAKVYAELGNLTGKYEGEDYAVLLMRFEDGGSGVAYSNYITKGGMQDRIEVYGSEGMAFMNLTHVNPISVYSDAGYGYVVEKASISKGWTSPVIDENIHYGFSNMVHHFADCILKDEEPRATGEFGREVLKTVFAGYESDKKKAAVQL
ncbi:MAG: Gfo/Idh/MocA family oxidoreductase [Candidatus Bathyarchaeota archaeon]|nr:Gfo/Idh/MocA family oxidoreductase [Candidatus Bathyarchaeota archaeon]